MRAAFVLGLLALCACNDTPQPVVEDAARLDGDINLMPDQAPFDAHEIDQAPADLGRVDAMPLDWGTPDAAPPVPSPCPPERGMVGIPFPDGRCSLMDPHLVSRAEYFEAQQAYDLSNTDGVCVRNRGEAPRTTRNVSRLLCVDQVPGFESDEEPYYRSLPWPPSTEEADLPMICLSWCDAQRYCEVIGKRLCGGAEPAEVTPERLSHARDPALDELMNACTAGGTRRGPAGDGARPIPDFLEVEYLDPAVYGSEGGYAGLHDLSMGCEYGSQFPGVAICTHAYTGAPCTVYDFPLDEPTTQWNVALARPSMSFRCCTDTDARWQE